MATEKDFDAFIATVDADIRTQVEGSALVNANDTMAEDGDADYWGTALATARMIADDPSSYGF